MPLEGHPGIGGTHAAAVVGDLDQGLAGILDEEIDPGTAGIDRIFQQFLHCGSGTLNDFTCCNLVGYGVGKQADQVGHTVMQKSA